jgi:hypothetical protein
MEILLILLFALYGIFVITLIFGWNMAVKNEKGPFSTLNPPIYVVVPVLNDESNIKNLLGCLKKQ